MAPFGSPKTATTSPFSSTAVFCLPASARSPCRFPNTIKWGGELVRYQSNERACQLAICRGSLKPPHDMSAQLDASRQNQPMRRTRSRKSSGTLYLHLERAGSNRYRPEPPLGCPAAVTTGWNCMIIGVFCGRRVGRSPGALCGALAGAGGEGGFEAGSRACRCSGGLLG